MSRVEGPVEQAYSFDLHGSDDLGDLADVGAFREIGDTLDYGFWTHVLLPPTVAEGELNTGVDAGIAVSQRGA